MCMQMDFSFYALKLVIRFGGHEAVARRRVMYVS